MFSTPSYWGVGEPFDDSRSGAPSRSRLAAAACATVGSVVSLGVIRLAGILQLIPNASMAIPNTPTPRWLYTPLSCVHPCVCAGGNPRARGVQMTTNKQRKSLTGDNWNAHKGHNRIKRLYEGEVYEDPGVTARKWNMEQRKVDLTPEGFRYPSMPQRSSGLGGNWGRIGPKFEYMAETEGKRDGAEVRTTSASLAATLAATLAAPLRCHPRRHPHRFQANRPRHCHPRRPCGPLARGPAPRTWTPTLTPDPPCI